MSAFEVIGCVAFVLLVFVVCGLRGVVRGCRAARKDDEVGL